MHNRLVLPICQQLINFVIVAQGYERTLFIFGRSDLGYQIKIYILISNHILSSVSIDIEISRHEMLSWGDLPNSFARFCSVLKLKQIWQFSFRGK